MINVLFFARLREELDCPQVLLNPAGELSVAKVRQQLIDTHPEWESVLSDERLLTAVNQVLVKAGHLVEDGDEVAFFPPVTGG
jgi:molybdopterin synthase sulfur carrier subunit